MLNNLRVIDFNTLSLYKNFLYTDIRLKLFRCKRVMSKLKLKTFNST
jgi:hypothetical protein